MVIAIEGHGTTEATWAGWRPMSQWSTVDATDFGDNPIIVAPHPDDEILGVAGLLTMLGAADIVAVTDGEASHPHATSETCAELARLRPIETDAALAALGGRYVVHRLRQPDGGIDEEALVASLAAMLRPGQSCVATWRGDGHPDHEAVGRAAAVACTATGARLWEYPIWMWHWAAPDDDRVDWSRARRLALRPEVIAAKATAIDAFISQITPVDGVTILPPHVLERFRRPYEVVFG